MKVVGILGSPRKGGNTATLVDRVLAGAGAAGAETRLWVLNDLNIKGCQACLYCKTHDHRCQLQDDMTPVYDDLRAAGAVVIGSPIYMGDVTAQTMLFINRLYAFLNPPGSSAGNPVHIAKSALVFSFGRGTGDYRAVMAKIGEFLERAFGARLEGILGDGDNNDPNAVKGKPHLLEEAYALGRRLAE